MKKLKDNFGVIIGELIFGVILLVGFFYATSASVWYSNTHDKYCEGGNCHCIKRLSK